MRPAYRYCAGWVCAAVAATSVSWVAIRDVVATAAVGDPVPSGAVVAEASGAADDDAPGSGPTRISTPTATTVASPSVTPGERQPPSAPASGPTGRATGPAPTATPAPSATGNYRGYVLTGGQVVVQLEPLSASLVTAVPAPGFETQTWKADGWFRVDFVGEERRSSIIVAFAGHPPVATITES